MRLSRSGTSCLEAEQAIEYCHLLVLSMILTEPYVNVAERWEENHIHPLRLKANLHCIFDPLPSEYLTYKLTASPVTFL